ncbi:hut operon positive regulatory protein [Propionispira arboris]|jgi:hut operon positive regulator|uniref:Hut operon positive regulatory protein n=1 Tax=Propionispira arboris TaxID=84035 RepID=A0A1H7BQ86_9FIRM|nr:HutP family protein [Propionispira arboris]SEJ79356.1 hut operon positive regulatory protein [Propionispira arboris]
MELISRMINGVGSAAMLLSMTRTIADEQEIKNYLHESGYFFAVTEVGGNTGRSDFLEKFIKSIIGAVLNNNVVKKEAHEVHAVLHAAVEAKKGVIMDTSSNISVKIAVVRKDPWVAVAIFGESAFYHTTNHERAGLGLMHI